MTLQLRVGLVAVHLSASRALSPKPDIVVASMEVGKTNSLTGGAEQG